MEVQGVYALDKEQATEYARQRGLRAYDSLETLVDDVDARGRPLEGLRHVARRIGTGPEGIDEFEAGRPAYKPSLA